MIFIIFSTDTRPDRLADHSVKILAAAALASRLARGSRSIFDAEDLTGCPDTLRFWVNADAATLFSTFELVLLERTFEAAKERRLDFFEVLSILAMP